MNRSDKQKQEQRHQEDLRRLQSFRPIDDTFMRGLFKENLPLAQLVLRIITGKPDLTLTKCETQADLKRVTGARSSRKTGLCHPEYEPYIVAAL